MYWRVTFSLEKLPQTARMSQMSSAYLLFFILAFFVICLNEDCRMRHQEIDNPGQQQAFLGELWAQCQERVEGPLRKAVDLVPRGLKLETLMV